MAAISLKGGEILSRKLGEIAKKLGTKHQISVGFMSNARYDNGTYVAMVAAIHNYGAPAAGIPARPFFTNMVQDQKSTWGPKLGHLLKKEGFSAQNALQALGEDIGGELRESIIHGNWADLSEITLMLRTMRSQDQGLSVTGKTVGQAAALISAGKKHNRTKTGSAPLIDTGHMLNSVTYRVDDGEEQQ